MPPLPQLRAAFAGALQGLQAQKLLRATAIAKALQRAFLRDLERILDAAGAAQRSRQGRGM